MKRFTMRLLVMCIIFALAPWAAAYRVDHGNEQPGNVVIRNATIWTQSGAGIVEGADLLIRDGKIAKIGEDLSVPDDTLEIDASDMHVTPGLIDCHNHTMIRGGVNEGSNNITAEVRIADVIDPEDIAIYRQLAGGLTTAHLLHGSANSIGGQDAVVKLKWNATADELPVDGAAAGIKFALGENPKRSNFRAPGVPQRYPNTRMGVNLSIRETFLAAQDYMREWKTYDALSPKQQARTEPPRTDLQLEAIAEILRGERLIHSHSYRQDEILALIRAADDFDVTIGTFQHVLEGYKVADEIAAHGAGASTFSDWWAYKLEAYDAIPYNGALMHDRDVLVTFNSDSSELARRMNLEAAKAVKYGGVEPQAALDFVTRNAAIQLGIDERTGSLERGKDADVVLWSGNPLSTYSVVEQTWVDGVRQFDRSHDLELREQVAQQRKAAIDQIKNGGKPGEQDDPQPEPPVPTGAPLFTFASMPYSDRLADHGGTVSIVGATVHTLAGDPIENGTVSFRSGRIVEIGAGLAPLAGATVVDAAGKHVYPGMIDALTVVGLTEIGAVSGSVDVAETGTVNPQVQTAIAVNPDSELIPVTRANGLTHVLTAPSGGLVSGSSALIRLDGWTWEDLSATGSAAMHVQWPSFRVRTQSFFGPPPASAEDQKKQREEQLEQLGQLFENARAYRQARQHGSDIDVDPALAAMLPVLDGSVPVIVHASQVRQVESALEWAEKESVRIIVAGAGDIWRSAELLASRQVPVILTGVLRNPGREDEPYDTAYTIAAKLHAAGVVFCISSGGGGFGASSTRNLPYHAAMAASFGLPADEALAAVTRNPARILGVGEQLGTLEVGKSASLFISNGDPLEITTRIEASFIDGRPIDVDANKHHRLYERYSNRPE